MTFEVGQKGKNKMTDKELAKKVTNFNKKIELLFETQQPRLRNENVKKYAEICKKFSRETYNYIHLKNDKKYLVTYNENWAECDTTTIGIDVSWAYRLDDNAIEFYAGEQLFENLMLLIDEIINNSINDDTTVFGLNEYLNNDNIPIDILEKIYFLFNI